MGSGRSLFGTARSRRRRRPRTHRHIFTEINSSPRAGRCVCRTLVDGVSPTLLGSSLKREGASGWGLGVLLVAVSFPCLFSAPRTVSVTPLTTVTSPRPW